MLSVYNVLSSQTSNCHYQCYCGLGLSKSVYTTVGGRYSYEFVELLLPHKRLGRNNCLRAGAVMISVSSSYFR